MADADSKATKKNAKRQAARAKKRLLDGVDTASVSSTSSSSSGVAMGTRSKLQALRDEMAAAKERGDHKTAQDCREQIWLLNDTAAGRVGEGFENAAAKLATKTTAPGASTAASLSATSDSGGGTMAVLSEPEKRIRALNKKLQQIDKIKASQSEGKKLEEGQLQKLTQEGGLRKEIAEMEKLLSEAAL